MSLENLLDKQVAVIGKAEVSSGAGEIAANSPRFRKMDGFSLLAVAAAKLALENAGVSPPADAGIVLATRYGPIHTTEEFLNGISKYGPQLASAFLFPGTVMNMAAGMVSMEFGLKGPSVTMVGEIEQALGYAADLIKSGKASLMLVGYVEEESELVEIPKTGSVFYVLEKRNA